MAAARRPKGRRAGNNAALQAAGWGLAVAGVAATLGYALSHQEEVKKHLAPLTSFLFDPKDDEDSQSAPASAAPSRVAEKRSMAGPVKSAAPLPPAEHVPQDPQRRERWMKSSDCAGEELGESRLTQRFSALVQEVEGGVDLEGRFGRALRDIERDVKRTHMGTEYTKSAVFRRNLRLVLMVLAKENPEVGYVQGMNFLVAFILLTLHKSRESGGDDDCEASAGEEDARDAFILMQRLLHAPRFNMRELYRTGLPGLHAVNAVMARAVQEHLPQVHLALQESDTNTMHVHEWWFCLFTIVLPWEEAVQVWDAFLQRGWCVAAQVFLRMLQELQVYLEGEQDCMAAMSVLKAYGCHRQVQEGTRTSTPTSLELAPPRHLASSAAQAFPTITPAAWSAWYAEEAQAGQSPQHPSPSAPPGEVNAGASSPAPRSPSPTPEAAQPEGTAPAEAQPPRSSSNSSSAAEGTGGAGSSAHPPALGESWLVVEAPEGTGSP